MTREEIEQLYVEEPNCFETGREEQWYKVGLKEGLAAADSHPHWIPIEERLPKRMSEKSRFSETVLVYNKEGFNDTAYYDYEEKIWRWLPGVTHWMEIVPPRKEDRE